MELLSWLVGYLVTWFVSWLVSQSAVEHLYTVNSKYKRKHP